jgi:hypothetical protein
LLRYLDGYVPHAYGPKWTDRRADRIPD